MLTARGADEVMGALPAARVVVFEFASLLIVPSKARTCHHNAWFSHTLLNPKLGYSTEKWEISCGLITAVRNHTSTVTLAQGEEKR